MKCDAPCSRTAHRWFWSGRDGERELRFAVLPACAPSLLPGVPLVQPDDDSVIAGLAVPDVPINFLRRACKVQLDLSQRLAIVRRDLDRIVRRELRDGLAKRLSLLIPLRPLLHTLLCRRFDLAKLCHVPHTCFWILPGCPNHTRWHHTVSKCHGPCDVTMVSSLHTSDLPSDRAKMPAMNSDDLCDRSAARGRDFVRIPSGWNGSTARASRR